MLVLFHRQKTLNLFQILMKVLHHQLAVLAVLAVLVVLAAAVTAVVLAANFSIVIKRHQSVPFLHAVTINIVTIKHSRYSTSHLRILLEPIAYQ
ncbi:hypothetical protein VCHA54P496_100147 [Vibrio chagasii]|nr:hypothetical protein VCHA54P495_100018 [Vibrio chagasii]CAH6937992.1 hypothetical protein VCHA54P496_100147 [Vibrio chagasii]CAH7085010.1 hypothetical protein VCHA36P166_70032 [Vibrio chagasii]CAH7125714.1 hypothetical protein VCHA54P486_100018 [Vibrio chagasii]